MPRVIITTDPSPLSADVSVWFDEQVESVHLSTDHAAAQFIERVAWAINDAENAAGEHTGPRERPNRQRRRNSTATRSRNRVRVHA